MKIDYKKIAKNTGFLYIRMVLIMAVSFYTIRVVLQILGETDYGIFTLVSSLVMFLTIMNNMLTSSTQRFLSFEIGRNDHDKLQKTFSTSLIIQIGLSVVILVFGETIGLWFLYHQLSIPIERMDAAFWVYQLSLFSVVVAVLQVPYHALIISHERMQVFALISIIEAILKLVAIFALEWISYDKLIVYAVLMLLVSMFIMLYYRYYAISHYPQSRLKAVYDKNIVKQIIGFSGWTLFGTLGSMVAMQGVNILLNLYFGPLINAAYAVSSQVYGGLQQLVNSFQTAVTPQIIKLYAANQIHELNELIFQSAKYAFLLLWLVACPILLELKTIISIWLVHPPHYTIEFTTLMIIYALMYSLLRPLVMAIYATGKLKGVQLTAGVLLILVLPISYGLLENHFPPYSPFVVTLVVWFFHLAIELYFLNRYIGLSVKAFFIETLLPVVAIVVISLLPSYALSVSMENNGWSIVAVLFCSTLFTILASYKIALDKPTRAKIKTKLSTLF